MDYKELRRLAASPVMQAGEWVTQEWAATHFGSDTEAKFVSMLSPSVVLALLEEIEGKKESSRGILIDAIIGRGFKSMVEADRYTKMKLARFTGNQWNEKWEWDRSALAKLEVGRLLSIYRGEEGK